MRTLICLTIAVALFCGPAHAQFRQQSLVTNPLLADKRVEAGVTIYEHGKDAFAKAPQLVLVGPPVTAVNGADGDATYDLTYAGSVALLSDGRIATFSSIGSKFFIFGTDGRGQKVIGRQGQAPGEFMSVGNMFRLPGDTLLLIDGANKRINWALADAGVVAMKARGTEMPLHCEDVVGVLPGHQIVIFSSGLVQDAQPDRITRPPATLAAITVGGPGREIVRLPDLELAEVATNYRGRKGTDSQVLRFTDRAHAVVWDTLLVTAIGSTYSFDVRNSTGKLLNQVKVGMPRRTVTRAMRDSAVAKELQRFNGPHSEGMVDRQESERLARVAPAADSLPPYSMFFTTPDHTLWVVDYSTVPDNTWAATAFRKDGAIIGRLVSTSRGLPMAFGDDRVLVRTEDADGVISLTVRKIGLRH